MRYGNYKTFLSLWMECICCGWPYFEVIRKGWFKYKEYVVVKCKRCKWVWAKKLEGQDD